MQLLDRLVVPWTIGQDDRPFRQHPHDAEASELVEPEWQQYWLKSNHILGWLRLSPDQAADFLNTGYLYVHFLGTIVFLVWLARAVWHEVRF